MTTVVATGTLHLKIWEGCRSTNTGTAGSGGTVDFLAALPLDKIGDITGWAVLVWVLLRHNKRVQDGDLVPRKTHEDTLTALAIQRDRNELLLAKLSEVTDSMETFEAFVRALPQPQQLTEEPNRHGPRPLPPGGQRVRRYGRDQWPDDQGGGL